MSPLTLRRYRADQLLRRDFEARRPAVLGAVRRRLAAAGVPVEGLELDANYAQAWHALYAALLAGRQIDNPPGWLVVVTFRRAVEDARAPAQSRRGALDGEAVAPGEDLADRVDDRDRLRHVFEGLRVRLDRRERQAATLCYLHGLTRAQAAAHLGISERRMRKLMDGSPKRPGVAAKIGELLDLVGEGRWCEQQASLMRGLAFGLLEPGGERHALAIAHQRSCPACRAYVLALRGLAAALPPVGMPLGLGVAAAGTAGAAGAASAGAGAGGGGWLLGGTLGAKVAAGCLLAAGVGVSCVALTAPSTSTTARAQHHSSARAAREARVLYAAAAHLPSASTGHTGATRPHEPSARAAAATSVRRASEPAAHREFGPESSSPAAPAPASVPQPLARTAAASGPARASAPEPQARREFGPG